MNNQEVAQKKPFYKKWWIWVLAVFVLFIIIGASGDSTTTSDEVTESNESPVAQEEKTNEAEDTISQEEPVTKTAPTPQSKSYQQVFTFSGNGNKKSEPFTITGSRFKVKYDCAGDPDFTLCQAFVYKVGSSLPEVIMNTDKSTKDETIIYGSGEYYIEANTIGSYTMVVEDYR